MYSKDLVCVWVSVNLDVRINRLGYLSRNVKILVNAYNLFFFSSNAFYVYLQPPTLLNEKIFIFWDITSSNSRGELFITTA
jgi:hypothetical protein